jgi:hypothetical protein
VYRLLVVYDYFGDRLRQFIGLTQINKKMNDHMDYNFYNKEKN